MKRMKLLRVVQLFTVLNSWSTWRQERIRFTKQTFVASKHVAIFRCEKDDLVDMEEIAEEMKAKLKCQFDLQEKQGLKHTEVQAAVGKKLYQCLRSNKRSISSTVSGIGCGL